MPPIDGPVRSPDFPGGTWLQGPPVSIHDHTKNAPQGEQGVVLVDFWEATCVHCLRTLPYLEAWHRRYRERGLAVVGVHTPEFALGEDPAVVRSVIEEQGLTYPVLLDPDKAIWRLFANHYWPAKYLVDHRGYLRWEHFGEGAYAATERFVQRLLEEAGRGGGEHGGPFPEPVPPVRVEDAPGAVCRRPSREMYLGYHHRGKLQSVEGYRPEEEVLHGGETLEPLEEAPSESGGFALEGRFFHAGDYLEVRSPEARLELVAETAGVYLVVSGPEREAEDREDEETTGRGAGDGMDTGVRGADAKSGEPAGDNGPGPEGSEGMAERRRGERVGRLEGGGTRGGTERVCGEVQEPGAGWARVELQLSGEDREDGGDAVDWGPLPAALRGEDVVEVAGETRVRWRRPGLVALLQAPDFDRRRLRLTFPRVGTRLYTVSFTGCLAQAG